VTTNGFLQLSALESLRDLPDFDRLEKPVCSAKRRYLMSCRVP
jgi:chromosome segregation and condensation protein ScpB